MHDATRSEHLECTESVRTFDGQECVGDYVSVPGPDMFGALLWLAFGVGTIAVGVNFERGAPERLPP